MARQSVDRHHPNPVADRVRSAIQRSPFDKPTAKRTDVAQCPWAVESEEFWILDLPLIPLDLVQPARDLAERRWRQSGSAQQHAQRVDVVADRLAAHESSLNGGRP